MRIPQVYQYYQQNPHKIIIEVYEITKKDTPSGVPLSNQRLPITLAHGNI